MLASSSAPFTRRPSLGLAALVGVTIIWGSTFALIKDITHSLHPSVLIAWRFSVAALVFLPFVRWRDLPWRLGLGLGTLIFWSYATQSAGLQEISANRSAFITGLNVVLVPLFAGLVNHGGVTRRSWLAALLAMLGIGVMSWEGDTYALAWGDALTIAGAAFFAIYVLVLEARGAAQSPWPLTCTQLAVVGGWGWLWALCEGDQTWLPQTPASWWNLLYLAVVASAVALGLQTLGQRHVSAIAAALTYALEPVSAALFSWFWLGETVGPRTWTGGCLVIVAMVVAQVPARVFWLWITLLGRRAREQRRVTEPSQPAN